MAIHYGNAWEQSTRFPDGAKTGWFLGTPEYMPDPPRQSGNVQIKWYCHPEGHESPEKPADPDWKTISVLIEGIFSIWCGHGAAAAWKQYILKEPGDYLLWDTTESHKWKAIKNSVILTVRYRPDVLLP